MKLSTAAKLLTIACSLSACVFSQQGAKAPPRTQNLIYSVKGADLFRAHCAACHGAEGKGNGPAAKALKQRPADLTRISERNGGEFPVDHVRRIISGEEGKPAHGSREMPVWGPIFHKVEWDQDLGEVRLSNLVKYLQSIQANQKKQ